MYNQQFISTALNDIKLTTRWLKPIFHIVISFNYRYKGNGIDKERSSAETTVEVLKLVEVNIEFRIFKVSKNNQYSILGYRIKIFFFNFLVFRLKNECDSCDNFTKCTLRYLINNCKSCSFPTYSVSLYSFLFCL